MKRFVTILMGCAAALTMAACGTPEGPTPDGPNPNDPENPTTGEAGAAPYTIEVDKTTIEANGLDVATFRVLDAAGNDLCVGDDAKKVYIQNVTENVSLGRKVTTFNSIINGTFEFTATFKGIATQNSVTVTAQNRVQYEKYKQMICVYDLTGTWCTACPYMTTTFEKVYDGPWGDQMIVMAVHAAATATDPFAIPVGTSDLGGVMLGRFGGSGYPTVIYDFNDMVEGTHSESEVVELLRKQIIDYPSTCGVKISKATLSGGTISIEASMTSTADGDYDMGYALLGNGLKYDGGTEEDGIYDDVVVAVSPNFITMQKDSKFSAKEGVEQTKSWTIDGVGNADPSKLRVVVFVLREVEGGRVIVDNANVCAVGSTADYLLNE